MGRLRRGAKRLALFTERHTPNPTRRWARAIARELDYIEGDWQSLTWALGGLRILILHGFVPSPTPELLEHQAALHGKLRRQMARRSPVSRILNRVNVLFSAVLFLFLLHHYYPAHPPTALATTLYCAGSVALLLRGHRQAPVELPEEGDTKALLRLYEADLRQNTQLSSVFSVALPMLAIFAGTELLAPASWVRVLGLIWPVLVMLYLQKLRANRVALHALAERTDSLPQ